MTTLELVIAGLALIWGPLPNCGTDCPATVYFPEGHGPQYVCGEALEGRHHLALVFDMADLDVESSTGAYTIHRVHGKEVGIEPICYDIELKAEGLGTKVERYSAKPAGCVPGTADFDEASFDCVVSVKDVHNDLSLHGGAGANRELFIPGGMLKARELAKYEDSAGNYHFVRWHKPGPTSTNEAIANLAVLKSTSVTGGVTILSKTGNCDGGKLELNFKKVDKLQLEISNLPSPPPPPSASTETLLTHLTWHFPLLSSQTQPDCRDWEPIRSDIPPDQIIFGDKIIAGVGSADVFCPPSSGP